MKTNFLNNKCFFLPLFLIIFAVSCNEKEGNHKKNIEVKYPETLRQDVTDTYFGIQIADPYQWLEDDRSEETQKWVTEQNTTTENYLSKIPFRNEVKKSLEKLWNYEKQTAPSKHGEWYYYYKNDGLQNQYVLYRYKLPNSEHQIFLDPNTLNEKGTAALSSISFSKNGQYMAYSISEAGSDWQTIFVKNTETSETLTDKLEWCKFTGMAWYNDGFYYSRYEQPDGSALSSANTYHKVYYHKLNTPQNEDELIFHQPEFPKRYMYATTSKDQRFLIVNVSEGTSGEMLYLKNLEKNSDFICLNSDFKNDHSFIHSINDDLYIKTNLNAPNYKLIKTNMNNPTQEAWIDVLPNQEKNVLESVEFASEKIFAIYMKDAYNQPLQFNLDGNFEKEIELPAIGSVNGFSGEPTDSVLYYTFTSFTYPTTVFSYHVSEGKSALYFKPQLSFNPEEFITQQLFYSSKDGTKIPMFVVHKKGLDLNGNNPTYLYSYGGFNISLNPSFDIRIIPFLENGGIYAMPNIRGGGEYGEKWHKNGMLLNKQNVFDDFISAAEFLIDKKYTSSKKLAIAGRSNGGLLVGACMTQRPDLYAVALPGVGVLDMLKYHKFTIGWGWAVEYGSSDDSLHFNNLLSYSPLHNIKKVKYPSTLVTTADHDDRVVPAHSFKFISELQHKHQGENPVLIRIDVDAGHGAGKPTSKIIDEWADIWSFVLFNLNEDFGTKIE